MPIRFTTDHDRNCVLSEFEGEVSDDELNDRYRTFYEGQEWRPGLNELVDLSAADMTHVTSEGLWRLAAFVREHFEKHGVALSRTAVYAPKDLPFGIARMYQASASESPENIRVFRDLVEAKRWIEEPAASSDES
jgi:hypothetical protein